MFIVDNEKEFIKKAHLNDPFLKQWVEKFGELPVHIQVERANALRMEKDKFFTCTLDLIGKKLYGLEKRIEELENHVK